MLLTTVLRTVPSKLLAQVLGKIRQLRYLVLLVALLSAASSPSRAQVVKQGLDNLGTDFWFGFMPNYTFPADYIYIFLASPTSNDVKIELYGGGTGEVVQTLTYHLSSNTSQTVTLDVAKAESRSMETPNYRAVHVKSSNPISVAGFSNQYATSDGFLAIPTSGLGKKYYTANFFDDWYNSAAEPLSGEFLIVAPFDSTQVTISTTSDTRLDVLGTVIGHRAGTSWIVTFWIVTLRKGQTYLVQSPGIDKGNDISGTLIQAPNRSGCSAVINDALSRMMIRATIPRTISSR